tara:strand:- start:2339 stop:2695 length:357 start_codon:yes stop_codon:yes gene_type:complete
MSKRGPKRLVREAVRIGEYGNTSWHIVLECDHSIESSRKPKIQIDKLCCKECLNPAPKTLIEVFSEDGLLEEFDAMTELKNRATLASHFGVSMEQVEIGAGTATIFLDAQQVQKIITQ